MTTVRTGNGCSKFLKAKGFSPVPTCKRKIAGVIQEWQNADGQAVTVGYCLYSNTSQSSRGTSAVWGYTVTFH